MSALVLLLFLRLPCRERAQIALLDSGRLLVYRLFLRVSGCPLLSLVWEYCILCVFVGECLCVLFSEILWSVVGAV